MSVENLTPAASKFVLHWGELGTRWGLNRSVAQIHALLYLSEKPLPAEEISRLLGLARSNVSTSLRELQGWGVIRIVHTLGDRRDFFEATTDVYEMFSTILEERKRREIDPMLALLRDCASEMDKSGPADSYGRKRIRNLLSFFEEVSALYNDLQTLPAAAMRNVLRFRSRIRKLVSGGAA